MHFHNLQLTLISIILIGLKYTVSKETCISFSDHGANNFENTCNGKSYKDSRCSAQSVTIGGCRRNSGDRPSQQTCARYDRWNADKTSCYRGSESWLCDQMTDQQRIKCN
ncbi:hypothetical protein DFH28DRAFT_439401 [Melampsora americana]|nr:hypothetical protein DFH28DRAFT_439401 [Melampsora americana]